jgi:hypothetical protein
MLTPLPSYRSVFFVHYSCDKFDEGTQIFRLGIYAKDEMQEFCGDNEAEFIEAYCRRVTQLCTEGLIPIHWNQNTPVYGVAHIRSRYKELTGRDIELQYTNCINLSGWLIEKYGDDYISHPRLNKLAELNNLSGQSTEQGSRTFFSNRLILLSKIYCLELNNKLKTATNLLPLQSSKPTKKAKEFPAFLIHQQKEKLADALKAEFSNEKGKGIRLMIEALKAHNSKLITCGYGEKMALYNAMENYFNWNIGTYNSIFLYDYHSDRNQESLNGASARIDHILENL